MKVINHTNIRDAENIIRLCVEGINIDTSDLTIHVMLPEAEYDKTLNGVFIPDNPPKIKIFVYQDVTYRNHNGYCLGITNIHQHIAHVFLHEFYHYAAWKEGVHYVKARQEPLADIFACQSLKKIGLNIKIPRQLKKNLRANTNLEFKAIIEEAVTIEEETTVEVIGTEVREVSGEHTNVILLPEYVDRASISSSRREVITRGPNGMRTTITIYKKRFHCGHIAHSGKDLGMDCNNKLPRNKRIPHWHENNHIVCKSCVIPSGCNGCGRPGDRLCLTLTNGKWFCVNCLNTY